MIRAWKQCLDKNGDGSLSLAEFTADTVASDPMALPSAPREVLPGEEDDRYHDRRGRDGDRYDRGPRTYENEDGERVVMRSEADENNKIALGDGPTGPCCESRLDLPSRRSRMGGANSAEVQRAKAQAAEKTPGCQQATAHAKGRRRQCAAVVAGCAA